MPDHEEIYAEWALRYEDLISHEDKAGAIPRAISEIVDPTDLDVVDLGAGTGRLASLLAGEARSLVLLDGSGRMLEVAAVKLNRAGHDNWTVRVSDLRHLPLEDDSADLVVSGWSICYVASSNQPNHRDDLRTVIGEIRRILRPGGTAIIFETLGTGSPNPQPPDSLTDYFAALENEHGFDYRWLRTDYGFASPEAARDLSAFFFGPEMPANLTGPDNTDLPECTGVWWRSFAGTRRARRTPDARPLEP